MQVTQKIFGKLPDGREVMLFTFACSAGMQFSIMNFGGIITSLQMPDRNGKVEEITSGFPDFEDYLKPHPFFGAIIGRFANRISNPGFSIDGVHYPLTMNNGDCQLHGGFNGFDKKLWDFELKEFSDKATLKLKYRSIDLEEGYPGNVNAKVTYTVQDNNSLEIEYKAATDKPTHVNLTNHAYYNLGGFKNTIEDHEMFINSATYLELNEKLTATGKRISCKGTVYDFLKLSRLADNNIPAEHELDYCFVFPENRNVEEPVAVLSHPGSGRRLKLFTTQPSMQVYSCNFWDGSLHGHNGTIYNKYGALALETQHLPNSPNIPEFPSTLLLPGEQYRQRSVYVFENF